MLFAKKLVSVFLLTAFVFNANAQSSNQQVWMSDQEAMRPSGTKFSTECEQNPEKVKKILDELEKKHLCGVGKLTAEECHTLFLATGAAATGGLLAAKAASFLGNRKVKPEDIVCGDAKSYHKLELLFSKAYAARYCSIRARSPLVTEGDNLARILGEQRDQKLDKYFKEFQKSNKTQAQIDSEIKNVAAKYKEYLAQALKNKEINEGLYQKIVADLDASIRQGSISRSVQIISNSKMAFKNPPTQFSDMAESLMGERRSLTNFDDGGKMAGKIAWLKDMMANGNFSDESVRAQLLEFKKTYPRIDVEGLMAEREEVRSLTNRRAILSAATNQFNYGRMSESEYIKKVTDMSFEKTKNPLVMAPLERLEKFAMGMKLNFHDMSAISRNVGRATKGLATTVGKAAMAAPMSGVDIFLFAGMPLNCERTLSDTQDGSKTFTMAAYNYMTLDSDTCQPLIEKDEKFLKLFELAPAERVKMARYNPRLCSLIHKLAEKELMGSKYKIRCEGDGTFAMLEPANSKLDTMMQEKFERETAGLSESEKQEYAKMSGKKNFDHKITVKGDVLQIKYPNTTAALGSCGQFSYNLKSQELSEKRNTCSALTSRVNENFYDYAQIANCCNGESSTYCDLYAKSFVDSDSASPGGGRSLPAGTNN